MLNRFHGDTKSMWYILADMRPLGEHERDKHHVVRRCFPFHNLADKWAFLDVKGAYVLKKSLLFLQAFDKPFHRDPAFLVTRCAMGHEGQ